MPDLGSLQSADAVDLLLARVAIRASALSIIVWDILDNVGLDYFLLRRFPIRLPTSTYLLARFSTFIHLFIPLLVSSNKPALPCEYAELLIQFFFGVAQSSTLFLFFLRLRAIYENKATVSWVFSLLWAFLVFIPSMASFGYTFVLFVTQRSYTSKVTPSASVLPQPGPCLVYLPKTDRAGLLVIVPGLTPLIFDTSVSLAIAFRLLTMAECSASGGGTGKTKSNTFVAWLRLATRNKKCPAISQALLRDGQKYYLLSSVLSVINTIVLVASPNAPPYRGYAGDLCLAITHICACRVFRNTKLGIFREDPRVPPSMSRLVEGGQVHGGLGREVTLSLAFANLPEMGELEGLRLGQSPISTNLENGGATGGRL